MHCRNCDYPLWNLRARQCPECGLDFRPSEYDFVCNSVQFCCPHCNQAYYGTGERGTLVPRQFTCVSCGAPCEMDEMVLRPASGVTEAQTTLDEHPWTTRGGRGLIGRWFKTVGQAMVSPASLGRAIGAHPDLGAAWRFALITLAVVMIGGIGLPLGFLGAMALVQGSFDADMFIFFSIAFLLYTGVQLFSFILWALIAHGVLRVSGGADGTIGRTFEVMLYSSGTTAGIAIPCIGPYCGSQIFWVWWIVSACIMLSTAQRVHGGRATLSVLTFPVLAVLAAILMQVGVMMFAVTAANRITPAGPVGVPGAVGITGQGEARLIAASMQQYAFGHNNQYPAHVLELAGNGLLDPYAFITNDSWTLPDEVPTPNGTLGDVMALEAAQIRPVARDAAAALPQNVVAYRFGDFVFTYPGITSQDLDPGLWVLILDWDPDANNSQNDPVYVGTTAGGVITFPRPSMNGRLMEQNLLRAKYGLPPLPDPSTVTHGAPATAGGN